MQSKALDRSDDGAGDGANGTLEEFQEVLEAARSTGKWAVVDVRLEYFSTLPLDLNQAPSLQQSGIMTT